MSKEYPCVYYDNHKCQKFSDEKYNAWCDFDNCEHQTPSNGDKIRAMSDEELAALLFETFWAVSVIRTETVLQWLRQPAEEDT